jgi:hypothetical protein
MWEHLFPARLFRAFWRQGSADTAWKHLMSQEEDRSHGAYFRFDVECDGVQLALDDVASMPHVAQMARDSALGSP